MVVSDLDGTLVDSGDPGYSIPRDLIESVQQFMYEGNFFTIATGRPEITALPVVKMLGVNAPFIAYNGAMILDKNGVPICTETFELKKWMPFLCRLQEAGATVLMYQNGAIYYLEYTERVGIYENKEYAKCCPAGSSIWDKDAKVNKILLIGNVSALKNEWETLAGEIKSKCRYLISEYNYMEIVKSGISKGSALKKLREYLKVQDCEVIGIGNHMNDLELLQEADIGVAVANAEEELKSFADYVTKGSFHQGVIEVIHKFK